MASIEVIRDQRPIDLAPVDPDVRIPDHVKRAAAVAESYYQKNEPAQPGPADDGAQPPQDQQQPPQDQQQPQDQQLQQQPPAQDQQLQQQPPQDQQQPPPVSDESWQHRYLSMEGRYKAAQRTIGSMQQQMQELGDELVRTQERLVAQGQAPARQENNHNGVITPEDEDAYGSELIDLVRRAARDTLSPELTAIKEENKTLRESVITTKRGECLATLTSRVPDWDAIRQSEQFKAWLRLPNVYTGQVRGKVLNAAYEAADAPKMIAVFKDYLNEVAATGQTLAPQLQQPPTEPAPTRQPAIPLEVLSSPGRARPAPGDSGVPADKPFFTRTQIANFYANVRRGYYLGRETEKAALEAQIFDAQQNGRVR